MKKIRHLYSVLGHSDETYTKPRLKRALILAYVKRQMKPMESSFRLRATDRASFLLR
jgi:hypothetical protein